MMYVSRCSTSWVSALIWSKTVRSFQKVRSENELDRVGDIHSGSGPGVGHGAEREKETLFFEHRRNVSSSISSGARKTKNLVYGGERRDPTTVCFRFLNIELEHLRFRCFSGTEESTRGLVAVTIRVKYHNIVREKESVIVG